MEFKGNMITNAMAGAPRSLTLEDLEDALKRFQAIGPVSTHVRVHPSVFELLKRECIEAKHPASPFDLVVEVDPASPFREVRFGRYERDEEGTLCFQIQKTVHL